MLDGILDSVAFVSPVAIALMSVLVGIKLAQNPHDQSHKGWWWAIIGLGIVCSAGTLWQQNRSRRAHSEEVKAHAEELNNQKQATNGLQSSLDYMNGQVAAFGSMLGQISQTGSLSVKEIANAMKQITQDNKSPNNKNQAIINKLSDWAGTYQMLTKGECSPNAIGSVESGAANTQAACDAKFARLGHEVLDYVCLNSEKADCADFSNAATPNEKENVIKQLIERHRKAF